MQVREHTIKEYYMATRVKESSISNSPVGKEKKDSHTSSHTKLTKTSTSSETHSCTTDHKQRIKSYLKPTLSSKTESFKNKKIGSSSSTVDHHNDNHNDHSNQHKATMNRRRSFDKPPSAASRFQKSLVSPGPRDRNAYLKSSTFSSKSSSKPINIGHDNQKLSNNATHSKLQYRPVSNKSHTKTATVSGGVNVKKNTTQNKNKEAVYFSASASSTKVPKSGNCVMTQTSTDHIEVTQEAYQSLVDHHDQIAEIEQSHEDHDDHEVQEVLSEDQLRSFENSNSEHVEENINEDKSGEQGDSTKISEEIKAKLSDGTSESIQRNENESNVTNDINSEESSVDPSGTKDEVVKEEIVKEGNDFVEEAAKEKENEKNEVKSLEEEDIVINVISGNEEEGGTSSKKEEEEVEKINGDEEQEEAKVEVKSQGEQGNKKESPAAYNDVIEETASKLLEKRKNKVRALVGAFETVIDYESK